VRRINVSLDMLDPVKYKAITRWGDHAKTTLNHNLEFSQ
jgi:cyclic pyranopterin phosphate synthase